MLIQPVAIFICDTASLNEVTEEEIGSFLSFCLKKSVAGGLFAVYLTDWEENECFFDRQDSVSYRWHKA